MVALVSSVAPYFEVLHPDILHDALLALADGEICDWVSRRRSTAAPALGAPAKGDEAFGCPVIELLCRAPRGEDGPDKGPDDHFGHGDQHGYVGGDDGDKGFSHGPRSGQLRTIGSILDQRQRNVSERDWGINDLPRQ